MEGAKELLREGDRKGAKEARERGWERAKETERKGGSIGREKGSEGERKAGRDGGLGFRGQ